MVAGVADTHAAIWFLSADPRLSAVAKGFFEDAAAARKKILLSSISLAEVVYLIEKARLPDLAFDELKTALKDPNHVLEEAPFTAEIVDVMRRSSAGYARSHRVCHRVIVRRSAYQP